MLTSILSAVLATQGPSAVSEICEIHVWQTKNYLSASPAPYVAYGIVGSVLQAAHDSKFPVNSIQEIMERELRPEALGPIIESLTWQSYLGERRIHAIIEPEVVNKDRIKALRSAQTRNSTSNVPCYVEIYLSDQTFEGGFIKSHLFNNFTVRDFSFGGYATGNAIVWSQLKEFPAQDEAGIPIATQNFIEAFRSNLGKFLEKKLKRTR